MRQLNELVITSQAAATITSPAIPAYNLFACSLQVTTTGSSAGTAILQASNDDPQDNSAPSNWTAIPSATVTVSGAASVMIPKIDLCYQFVRVVYTNTGTGTISARFKALGA